MAVKPVAAAITNLQLGAPQTEFAETISVTMLRNIYNSSGTLLQAKTTQSVSGTFAKWLVENQYATTTSSSLPMESNLRIGPEQAQIQALVSGDVISGQWRFVVSLFRLSLGGTGTVTMDSMDSDGNITLNSDGPWTVTAAQDQIEFPYAGDDAVQIRLTLTGTATAKVI